MVPEIWSAPDIIFCHFRPFFALLPLYGPKKSKFSKKQKKYLKILSFSKDKSQSYDIWFLRYGVQWTECFVILGHFCPFTPLTAQKIKILKKWIKMNEKNESVPKIMIRWCTLPEIWCVTNVIIFYFGPFFALSLPP